MSAKQNTRQGDQNFIDGIIGYFSPVQAAKRLRARQYMAIAGSYIGASRTRRATKEWMTWQGSPDADIYSDLPMLRQRSRDLIRNNPISTGAIGTAQTNVVGTGLKLQSRIDRKYLPLSDEHCDLWEDKAEREFNLWAESQNCDASRTLNFYGLQNLVFRSSLENGDCFAVRKNIKRSFSPYELSIALVEADRVCNKDNAPDSETLFMGVKKDDEGAPLEYHILTQHPGSNFYKTQDWITVPAFSESTGLRNCYHLYQILRPGQTRGVPYLAPVIEALKLLDRYTEAELMAAVVSGLFTVFIESESGGLDFDLAGGMAVESEAKADDDDLKLSSGAVLGLQAGEKISTADPTRPNPQFDAFCKSILQQIGAALGIPYEILIRNFQSSYSASRAALLEAWRFFKGRRKWLSSSFCQPIYEAFLYEAIARGRLAAPGYFRDPMVRKAYSGSEWIGDAPGYIDPQKDGDAAVVRMENYLSTLDEETALLGGDAERNLPRILKERKLLMEAGLWQPKQPKQLIAPPDQPTGGL
jgi:lambda family phage portal protein